MRRCGHCQYENNDDATVCARCGERMAATGAVVVTVGSTPSGQLPDWLTALPEEGAVAVDDPSPREQVTAGAGVVAEVAALPVQVRRSRVPVLSVDARRISAASVAMAQPTSEQPRSEVRGRAARAGGHGRRVVLLVALILLVIVLAVLAQAVLHGPR